MRIHSRLLLGMCGLALAVPTMAVAAPFGDANVQGPYAAPGGQPPPQTAPHTHKGLFGRRHCVECQREYVKAHDGVDVPAPPSLEPGATMHGHAMAGQGGSCSVCQGNPVVTGPALITDAHAPGYAVVGGPGAMASADAPGYAVVGDVAMGQDPAPIGISKSAQGPAGGPRMAAMGASPGANGAYDPSVVPTSAIPPAQVAMKNPEHERRYKVVAHALGVPKFGSMRRKEEDRERQKHAAIAYDQPGAKVSELPASMVYGAGGH
jgi:hypothetical protein